MNMKKLLIVIDMQNDFLTGTLGTKEAESIIPNVVTKIKTRKEEGYDIWFTQDTHQDNYLQTQEGKRLPVVHCIDNTEGWEIREELFLNGELTKYKIFEKNVFPSFELGNYLYTTDYDIIEIIGVCTGICIISNACIVKSVQTEAEIIVDASCCACVSPESHLRALESLKMLQVKIINE